MKDKLEKSWTNHVKRGSFLWRLRRIPYLLLYKLGIDKNEKPKRDDEDPR